MYRIEILWLDLKESLKCVADWLGILDLTSRQPIAGPLCGRYYNGIQVGITNSFNIKVFFHSDLALTGHGFEMKISMVKKALLKPTSNPMKQITRLIASENINKLNFPSTSSSWTRGMPRTSISQASSSVSGKPI